jgi:hypothetical protein
MNPLGIISLLLHILVSAHSAYNAPQAAYEVGVAKFYRAGLLEHVAQYRGVGLDGASGFATYPDCARIGEVLWVSVKNPVSQRWTAWESKRVVDCSEVKDYQRHVREGLVELAYDDAVKYGYAGEGKTSVRFYLEGGK